MRIRTGTFVAAASVVGLVACEPVGVTVGAEYRYHDAFWYDDDHRARAPRPERPDRPARPDRPKPPATTLPARPGGGGHAGGGGHLGGGGHGRR